MVKATIKEGPKTAKTAKAAKTAKGPTTPRAAGTGTQSVYAPLKMNISPDDSIHAIMAISEAIKEPLDALTKVAEEYRMVFASLGGSDSEHLEKMVLRLRSVNQQVSMAVRRYIEKKDDSFKALALHNIESLLRSEAAIDGLLAHKLLENLYLTDLDNPERWSMFQFSAPPYFASVVAALRHEMERRTGRRIQDHDVILAAIRYCHVEIETVLGHPMFAGHLEALMKQPKVRTFPLVPAAPEGGADETGVVEP